MDGRDKLPKTLRRAAVGLTALLLAAGATVAAADAAIAAPLLRSQVVGDLTGDGIADRLSLTQFPDTDGRKNCGFRLETGLGGGRYAAARTGALPIASVDPDGVGFCPDAAVLLKAPNPARNQIAVTNTFFTMSDGPSVQTFTGFTGRSARYTGGFDGVFQTSVFASVDFDGDGYGDIWENTDQGDGFQAFVGRPGVGWHTLYASPFTNSATPQFFDLNHNGGTDILTSWTNFGQGSGVSVVDGRTGAVQVLAQGSADDFIAYNASVVDLNYDRLPDIQVTADPGDGTTTTQRFVNRSANGRWFFQALPAAHA